MDKYFDYWNNLLKQPAPSSKRHATREEIDAFDNYPLNPPATWKGFLDLVWKHSHVTDLMDGRMLSEGMPGLILTCQYIDSETYAKNSKVLIRELEYGDLDRVARKYILDNGAESDRDTIELGRVKP